MPMPSVARPVRRPSRLKVGDRITLPWVFRKLRGKVIEDLGNLGPEGQQVVRIVVGRVGDPVDHFEMDIPVDWLAARRARATRH